MKQDFDIYEFERLLPLLKDISARPLQAGKNKLSLRGWANRLGYRSPRSVGMVFVGQRLPSSTMINRLGSILHLNSDEKDYLRTLLALEKTKNNFTESELLKQSILKINPQIKNEEKLLPEKFAVISKWEHIVIKQLFNSKYFDLKPNQIKSHLKDKLTDQQISQAIRNLETIGLIQYNSKTQTYQSAQNSFSTTDDVPSEAIQQHHQQMMCRAAEALKEEGVENREFDSMTISFDRKYLPEVKRQIRNFRDRMEKTYEDKNSIDVFQLNIQFFPHTGSKS